MIQSTSLQAYENVKKELGYKQLKVFYYLNEHISATNTEIANGLGLPINTITPRVFELRQKELVVEKEKRKCFITHRQAIAWKINTEEPKQKEFLFSS